MAESHNTSSLSKITNSFLFVILFVGIININLYAADKASIFDIERVSLDKKIFNPTEGEDVNISFEINEQADVNVIIYDVLGKVVRIFNLPESKIGQHSVTWNGRMVDGSFASGGLFLYVIEAVTKDGKKAIYNKVKESGGLEVKSLEYTLDRDTGKIEYVLPKACMIRIRAGFKDGMFAKTLVDWEPRLPGRQNLTWDGKDESGLMNLLKHKGLDIRLTCYTLPDNAIGTKGEITPFTQNSSNPDKEKYNRDEIWATKGKYMHYQHDPRICHAPKLMVSFPSVIYSEESDTPKLSGVATIRVELDKIDEPHLIDTRFEVMFFVDGTYIYEVEEGSSPFTFHWNTSNFSKGPHMVTINVIGYDDHIGIVSKKVIVGE